LGDVASCIVLALPRHDMFSSNGRLAANDICKVWPQEAAGDVSGMLEQDRKRQ